MDRAANEMVAWMAEAMPDATPEGFARKFAEEAGELLGIEIVLPDDWSYAAVDPTEARDCALVLVALRHAAGGCLGAEMGEKMAVNRGRRQYRQPDGTYHHRKADAVASEAAQTGAGEVGEG